MRHIICDMIKRMYALVVNIRVSGPLSSQNSKKFKRNLKSTLRNFLYFLKKSFSYILGNGTFWPQKKIFLKKFIVFSQKMFSLYLRNWNFVVALNFFQKFFFSFHILRIRTFQRIFWCIRRELSEPWNHFLYFSKWDFLAIKT